MLLQADEGEIRLLPALPSAWPAGRVTGLRAPGGFEIDLAWKDGAVDRVSLRSLRGEVLRLRRGAALRTLKTRAGQTVMFTGDSLRPSAEGRGDAAAAGRER
jgi:alpha-L-fucosidase 2